MLINSTLIHTILIVFFFKYDEVMLEALVFIAPCVHIDVNTLNAYKRKLPIERTYLELSHRVGSVYMIGSV